MKTLKYAGRFLMRSKSYTIINLLGLAFSLACCIILMRYIHRELTVDTHILHSENVYLIMRDVDGNIYPTNTEDIDTTYFAAEQMMENTLFLTKENDNILSQDIPYKAHILVADSNYFHFFHYRAVQGSASLKAPDDVLLMQHFARKLFGKENPIGKTLQYDNGKIVTVRGVLKNPDCKTSYSFDLILNMSLQQKWGQLQGQYIRLTSDVSVESVNRISNVYRKTQNGDIRHRLVPVHQFYWDEAVASNNHYPQMEHHGNRSHIYLLMGVCFLVFLIGIINFVNIYLVLMMKRSKEYGIKLIHTLKKIEKEIYGTEDFEYIWLKDKVAAQYDKDRQLAQVYLLFAFIAVAISCLGLFGLSLFDIRQRYREIAIRKVNGSGIRDLYRLLLRKYMIVLGGAFVIAVPLSYYFIYMYTRNFIVKAPVGIGIYLLALGVVLIISAGTLAWQIRKAAHIDPAKIIKTE